MRARSLLALAVAVLVTAAPAAAQGPVFVVISPEPSVKADRGALAQVRRERRRIASALVRARSLAATAPLLSDRLDAGKAVFQLEAAHGVASDSVTRLERQLASLEAEANAPAVAPVPVLQPSYGTAPLWPTQTLGDRAVSIAEQYLGVPYVWGGADPAAGFDCSGLVQYVYAQLGIPLAHYAATQFSEGAPVPDGQLLPGDLVFFEPHVDGPGHVGIYVGGDQFLEAPHTGDVVKIASLSEAAAGLGYLGAVRPYAVSALGV